jgi:hypothetical protein
LSSSTVVEIDYLFILFSAGFLTRKTRTDPLHLLLKQLSSQLVPDRSVPSPTSFLYLAFAMVLHLKRFEHREIASIN